MDERAKDEVLAAYAAYVAGFRANDVQAIDRLMQYPLAHIGNGQITLLDAFLSKPAELKAAKQWRDNKHIAGRWCSPQPIKLTARAWDHYTTSFVPPEWVLEAAKPVEPKGVPRAGRARPPD